MGGTTGIYGWHGSKCCRTSFKSGTARLSFAVPFPRYKSSALTLLVGIFLTLYALRTAGNSWRQLFDCSFSTLVSLLWAYSNIDYMPVNSVNRQHTDEIHYDVKSMANTAYLRCPALWTVARCGTGKAATHWAMYRPNHRRSRRGVGGGQPVGEGGHVPVSTKFVENIFRATIM